MADGNTYHRRGGNKKLNRKQCRGKAEDEGKLLLC